MLKLVTYCKQIRCGCYYVLFLNWFKKGWHNAKKNTVQSVVHFMFNCLEKPKKISKDFGVKNVGKLLFGNANILNNIAKGIGLNCGLKKVIPLDSLAIYQAIAKQNLNVQRIIGWKSCPKRILIITNTNTFFLTEPTFTRMAA